MPCSHRPSPVNTLSCESIRNAMPDDAHDAVLATLRDIRDGQREVIKVLAVHKRIAEEQIYRYRETIQKSVSLQELALKRQKMITAVALPGVIACVAAIAY